MSELLEYCRTPAERKAVEAVLEHGTATLAAEALDRDVTGINHHLRRVRGRAAQAGVKLDEVTTRTVRYTDADGNVITERRRSTNKVDPHTRTYEAWCEAVEDYCANKIKPLPKTKFAKQPKRNPDLIDKLVLTDYHLGMLACLEETGDNWDTKIARKQALAFIDEAIERSSNAQTALLNVLGDFLHWDSLIAETPTSRHVVDTDTRYQRLIRVALRLGIDIVRKLLTRYETVHVMICEGNHDLSGSAWLRESLRVFFADEDRVVFVNSDIPYYAMQWGYIMLAAHHGHIKAKQKLPEFFASEPRFREMWGQCTYCYIDTGHLHHEHRKESGGAYVEQHPTLASRDGYAARGGFISHRGAYVTTYHKERGEDSRIRIVPQ